MVQLFRTGKLGDDLKKRHTSGYQNKKPRRTGGSARANVPELWVCILNKSQQYGTYTMIKKLKKKKKN